MKKHFLFFAMLLLGGAGLLRAQETVLYSDDFESGNLDNWTLIDADGDGYNWNAIIPNYSYVQAHSGRYSAYSFSWKANVVYTPDNYLVSPLVEGATKVHYYVIVNADFPDHYGVAVSSTGTDPGDFSVVFEETVPGAGWIEKEVELPAGTKYVAFRHYDSDDNESLFIDDVTISAEINAANVLSTANWYCQDPMNSLFLSFNMQNLETINTASGEMPRAVAGSYAKGNVWFTSWSEWSNPQVLLKAQLDNHNNTLNTPVTVVEDFGSSSYKIYAMSFNHLDGKMYYLECSYDEKGRSSIARLGCFDLNDPVGTQTTICSMEFLPVGFAIDKKGHAYCLRLNSDELYGLNLNDGSTTLVGHTGLNSGQVVQNLAFDMETDELIWAANQLQISDDRDAPPVMLFKLNPSTAAAEFIFKTRLRKVTCFFSVLQNEGVADTQGSGLALWPNPAGNTLYLEDMDDERVSVYDYTGRLVLQETYQGQLNLGDLTPGVYVVAAKGRSMRFVKE